MIAEIISIGTELLLGDVINTNASFISKELSYLGIDVHNHIVVGDNQKRFKEAFLKASERANIIITTGGLGPTFDDMSKEAIVDFFNLNMYFDEKAYANIKKIFNGRHMAENNKKQAYIPEGAIPLYNENGTAPGLVIKKDKITIIMLPGPPYEMEPMFIKQVIPILEKDNITILHHHNLHVFGMGESSVEEVLGDIMIKSNNPSVAPYATMGELMLRVTASASTKQQAEKLILPTIEIIKEKIGKYIYGIDINNLEEAVVTLFKKKNITLSLAESCTGGLISSRIVSIPGSSDIFGYGVVSYANEAKKSLIGVNASTLKTYGAVSSEVAIEMAEGVRKISNSTIGISSTGIAGPTGGSVDKPVGLVYIGVSTEKESRSIKLLLNQGYKNERDFIRFVSASHALKLALDTGKSM